MGVSELLPTITKKERNLSQISLLWAWLLVSLCYTENGTVSRLPASKLFGQGKHR